MTFISDIVTDILAGDTGTSAISTLLTDVLTDLTSLSASTGAAGTAGSTTTTTGGTTTGTGSTGSAASPAGSTSLGSGSTGSSGTVASGSLPGTGTSTTGTGGASPNDTVITPGSGTITDSVGNEWTVTSGGVVDKNGLLAGYSANVRELALVNGSIWQEAAYAADNGALTWWKWNGTTWVGATTTNPLPVSGSSTSTGSATVNGSGGTSITSSGSSGSATGTATSSSAGGTSYTGTGTTTSSTGGDTGSSGTSTAPTTGVTGASPAPVATASTVTPTPIDSLTLTVSGTGSVEVNVNGQDQGTYQIDGNDEVVTMTGDFESITTPTSSTGSAGSASSTGSAGSTTGTIPAAAIAAGYTSETFGPTLTLGQNFFGMNFFGYNSADTNATQNSNGTISLSGAGGGLQQTLTTASAGSTPSNWTGEAFGGGGYFQATIAFIGDPTTDGDGWPSFFTSNIEGITGGTTDNDGVEVDGMEFDTEYTDGLSYGSTMHNWYGGEYDGSGSDISTQNPATMLPAGTDLSQPHTYGFLWIPATATTQGSMSWFFDGQQVGTTDYWNQYNPSLPPTADPYSVIDTEHLVPIVGTGPDNPMTISNVEVWQASTADDLVNGQPVSTTSSAASTSTTGTAATSTNPSIVLTPSAGSNLTLNAVNYNGVVTQENNKALSTSGTTVSAASSPAPQYYYMGTSGNDTMIGGGDANIMVGNGGNDTYQMGKTDTVDTISNGISVADAQAEGLTAPTGPSGTLTMAAASTRLWLQQSGSDLLVDVLGTSQQADIQNWYDSSTTVPYEQLASIVGSDGATLSNANVNALVQAMATFSAANPAFNPQSTTNTTVNAANYGSTLAAAESSAFHS